MFEIHLQNLKTKVTFYLNTDNYRKAVKLYHKCKRSKLVIVLDYNFDPFR